MPEFRKPRDIEERAFRFACRVLVLSDQFIRRGGVAAIVGRQLAAAGTSVGSNLEEAVGAQSRADFVAKVFVSLKESRESHYWLRLASAVLSPLPPGVAELKNEARELVAITTAIAKKARAGLVKR